MLVHVLAFAMRMVVRRAARLVTGPSVLLAKSDQEHRCVLSWIQLVIHGGGRDDGDGAEDGEDDDTINTTILPPVTRTKTSKLQKNKNACPDGWNGVAQNVSMVTLPAV